MIGVKAPAGRARPLPLTSPPFPNETVRSYATRLALLNGVPPKHVLRRFYSAERPLDRLDLLAVRSGQTPKSLRKALPELTTATAWHHPGYPLINRTWACDFCAAAHTGKTSWRIEIWGLRDLNQLCVKHRRWTGSGTAYDSYFERSVEIPSTGQCSVAQAPEIVEAQRRLHRLCRHSRYRRILPAYEECSKFWRDLTRHGYAADRTERRLRLIHPDETSRHRPYPYAEAADFPDVVQVAALFASFYWRKQALGSQGEVQRFRREFDRRLPAERKLRTTAIPWLQEEIVRLAQRVDEAVRHHEASLDGLVTAHPHDQFPPLLIRRILKRSPAHAR
ncbi:TniQ family protein [Streptomyces sp. RGM 3693]|uniref:TniQ family protein n=1 Tax=Streptomyces sp. RGM 3693 TaxID=3413284 RepID=UPI003D2AB9C4